MEKLDAILKTLDTINLRLERIENLLRPTPALTLGEKTPEHRVFQKNTLGPVAVSELCEPFLAEFFQRSGLDDRAILLWLKTYGDAEWLKLEFHKMIAWLDANAHKKPKKNYKRFVTNWLSRAWETHRKHLPSKRLGDVDYEKLHGEEQWN